MNDIDEKLDKETTLGKLVAQGVKLTPMMSQYYEIKKNHHDKILFFRMGDFYEVFFEDAVQTSKSLNISLTHRGKIGDIKIPMAGIPHHAAPTYVDRLTNQGLKVAICEQVEDPKATKGIVKRAVTQVVSPGIPYDFDKQNEESEHYLASGFHQDSKFYLVALDFTTGNFIGEVFDNQSEYLEAIRLLAPKEFITSMGQWDHIPEHDLLLNHLGALKTHLSEDYFNPKFSDIYIEKFIPGHKRDQVLKKEPAILHAIGALSYYVLRAQDIKNFCHIRPFRLKNKLKFMKVTMPTLTGLEIVPSHREDLKESLLGFFNKTKTSIGFRKLSYFFTNPLQDLKEIKSRQVKVKYFLDNTQTLEDVRESLNTVRDLERILAKIATAKVNGSDLINISHAITAYLEITKSLTPSTKHKLDPEYIYKKEELSHLLDIKNIITSAIDDSIGASLEKGNLIKDGYNAKRDKLAKRSCGATTELEELEERYKKETMIPKLRIKSNNVAGFFIEVSRTASHKVPDHFTRRQTLTNAERYTCPELVEFETKILKAKTELSKVEREIFQEIILTISMQSTLIQKLSDILSLVDVYQSFAYIARSEDFSCPEFHTKSGHLHIEDMWHPLIKASIKDQFVSHDIHLDDKVFFGLITGPNMAGKTTVMREVAIVQILAQIGSFVPASFAKIGLCDYLFSRLGASDDILRGQSTFMVEMSQTSEILRHASSRSLIILDEVGRGTSTYDGLSIAWALIEHFVRDTKAITLFATHYHELISLAEELPQAKNFTVETHHNENGDVNFLYKLIEEGAQQSYGIYVAKLAGIPPQIISRSSELLANLETAKSSDNKEPVAIIEETLTPSGTQLDFLGCYTEPKIPDYLIELEEQTKDLDIMNMTPIQALQKLQSFKELVQ